MTAVPVTAPASRKNAFANREFGLRVVSGLVLAAIVVTALMLGGWAFAVIWLAAGIVGAAEWIGMSRTAPRRALLAIVAGTLILASACFEGDAPRYAVPAILALGAGLCLVVAQGQAGRLRALGALFGGAVIALVPVALRDAPAIGILGPAWMFAVVWSTDVVAYFTGRTLGGPKLMPRVSPKKTWSGALGGLAGAVAAGIGIVASVLSQGGDLVESGLKRRYGVKDSGASIPGHGGVMDRLDGFFAVALLAALYLILRRLTA